MFKKTKFKTKLFLSFFTLVIFLLAAGIISIVLVNQINNSSQDTYAKRIYPLETLEKVKANYAGLRLTQTVLMLRGAYGDLEAVETANTNNQKQLEDLRTSIEEHLTRITQAGVDQSEIEGINEFKSAINDAYAPNTVTMYECAKAKDLDGMLAINKVLAPYGAQLTGILNDMFSQNMTVAGENSNDITQIASRSLIILVIFCVLAIVCATALVLTISRSMGSTLDNIGNAAKEIALGNLDVDINYDVKDEIGRLVVAFNKIISSSKVLQNTSEAMANGDLTVAVSNRSDKDAMNIATNKMIDTLNLVLNKIKNTTNQVSNGAVQISGDSNQLAQSAAQQAIEVENLLAAVTNMLEKTKENSNMANDAAELAESIKSNAEKGSYHMDNMMQAVKEINEASQSISKVIKVIDDIAFQTNILALNAAVEAARAGQHGKGFAVVAEEVRNLAAKSAEAAKDTGVLIANSMEKAQLGAQIAQETSSSLNEIVAGINESTVIVSAIAQSSEAQTNEIGYINQGIKQVSASIDQNKISAVESAGVADTIRDQSEVLEDLISQFKLKGDGSNYSNASNKSRKPKIELSSNDFKYIEGSSKY